jgi:hypothetical protein
MNADLRREKFSRKKAQKTQKTTTACHNSKTAPFTTMTLNWIAGKLKMGAASSLANLLRVAGRK